jgi:S1-C subfamily serine protease
MIIPFPRSHFSRKSLHILAKICLWLFFINSGQAWSQPFSVQDRLISQIKKVKPSIIAVGTYHFKATPKRVFYGTGFVVGDGKLIVTAAHTITKIEEDEKLKHLRIFHQKVRSNGLKSSLLKKDKVHDLALLKIEAETLPPLILTNSTQVQEGEAVAFTGYPIGLVLGLNPTTHTGIISAIAPIVIPSPTAHTIKKEILELLRQPYDIFQIDANAYPGNSGGPVYRISNGEVIGILNKVFVKGKKEHLLKDPSGISYAIPSNHARALIGEYYKDQKQ